MDYKIAQNKKQYDSQLKNLKPIVIEEAIEVLHGLSKSVTNTLTQAHHKLLENIIE